MLTGWHKIDGKWYYLDPNGIMLTEWLKDDSSGDWYYLSPNGDMVSGVMELDGRIYYLGSPDSGRMETGTIRVNGRNYTFGENGEATDYKKPSAERTFQTVRNADGTLSVSETTSQKYYIDKDGNDDSDDTYQLPATTAAPSETPTETPSEAPAPETTSETSVSPTPTPTAPTATDP